MTISNKSHIPQTAIGIDRFAGLEEFAERFANDHFNVLAVVGNPGIGKSRLFCDILDHAEVAYRYLNGHVRPFILYQIIYEHRDQIILLDDADSLFGDKSCVPLLKCLLETRAEKTVSWHSRAIDDEEMPRSFVTRSRVIILCNEWRSVNQNMKAVEDRAIFVNFAPSVYEVHERIGGADWFNDDVVYEFIEKHLHLITEPSMRYYIKANELRSAGISGWEDKVLRMLNPDSQQFQVLSEILNDDSYPSERERVVAYKNKTGRSQATYYRDRDRLLAARGVTATA